MACSLSRNSSASSILTLLQRAEKVSRLSDAYSRRMKGVQAESKRKEAKIRLWVGGWLVKAGTLSGWVKLKNQWGLEEKGEKVQEISVTILCSPWGITGLVVIVLTIALSNWKSRHGWSVFLTYHVSHFSSHMICGPGKLRPQLGKWHSHSQFTGCQWIRDKKATNSMPVTGEGK